MDPDLIILHEKKVFVVDINHQFAEVYGEKVSSQQTEYFVLQ